MSDDNVKETVSKLIRVISVVLWFDDMKLRGKMAWAVLRGRSVCYRMDISPEGVNPTTHGGKIVENHIHGLDTGIVINTNHCAIIRTTVIGNWKREAADALA